MGRFPAGNAGCAWLCLFVGSTKSERPRVLNGGRLRDLSEEQKRPMREPNLFFASGNRKGDQEAPGNRGFLVTRREKPAPGVCRFWWPRPVLAPGPWVVRVASVERGAGGPASGSPPSAPRALLGALGLRRAQRRPPPPAPRSRRKRWGGGVCDRSALAPAGAAPGPPANRVPFKFSAGAAWRGLRAVAADLFGARFERPAPPQLPQPRGGGGARSCHGSI